MNDDERGRGLSAHADLHAAMRVGIVHFMAYPTCMNGEGPILQTLEALAFDDFFDVIEVTQIKDSGVRKEAAALLAEAGVEVYFAAQPLTLLAGLNLEDADPVARARAVQAVAQGIEQAAELGAHHVSTMSGPLPAARDDFDAAVVRLRSSLEQLCGVAAAHGVTLDIESFDQGPHGSGTPNPSFKDALIGTTRSAVELVERIRADRHRFGLLLDLAHVILLEEPVVEAVHAARSVIQHVHLSNTSTQSDSPLYGDTHPRFGAPTTRVGGRQIGCFLRSLSDIEYIGHGSRGLVSFEIKPAAGESSAAIVAGAKRALRRAWSEIRS
jgi:sugar phosphate isomerase/epimerase